MPTVRENQIHLWCEKIDWTNKRLSNAYLSLADQEKETADRFKVGAVRNRKIASIFLTKQILTDYLGNEPEFAQAEHGKPYLVNSELKFNVSHSESYYLLAVANQEVGVDIQFYQPVSDYMELAKRFFAEAECQQLQAMHATEREIAFFRGWARKEAFVKFLGRGLMFGLENFVVDLADTEQNCLLSVATQAELTEKCAILPILSELGSYQAAVASQGQDYKVCYQHFG